MLKLDITGFTESEVMAALLPALISQRDAMTAKIAAIQAAIGKGNGKPAAAKTGGRGPLSPEARANIVAAQKKRWAKIRRDKKAALKAAEPAVEAPVEEELAEVAAEA